MRGLSRWRVLLAYTTFRERARLCDSNDLASLGHGRKQPILAQCDKPLGVPHFPPFLSLTPGRRTRVFAPAFGFGAAAVGEALLSAASLASRSWRSLAVLAEVTAWRFSSSTIRRSPSRSGFSATNAWLAVLASRSC